jgi:hypothetical protein
MHDDLRRQHVIHVERCGMQPDLPNCPVTAKAVASLKLRTLVCDITAKKFADLHQAESATWREEVKEYFQ